MPDQFGMQCLTNIKKLEHFFDFSSNSDNLSTNAVWIFVPTLMKCLFYNVSTKKSHGSLLNFFVQTHLIWNILCCCFRNWLLGYFLHSNFVKECKFLFKILKWQQTWKFSEFQKSAYKIVIFWSIHPKLNFLYSNERVYHRFSAYLGFHQIWITLKTHENVNILPA